MKQLSTHRQWDLTVEEFQGDMYVCALWIWICESTHWYNVCMYRYINIKWNDVKYEKFKLNKKIYIWKSEKKAQICLAGKLLHLFNTVLLLQLHYNYRLFASQHELFSLVAPWCTQGGHLNNTCGKWWGHSHICTEDINGKKSAGKSE